jgi:hypothetical protein
MLVFVRVFISGLIDPATIAVKSPDDFQPKKPRLICTSDKTYFTEVL